MSLESTNLRAEPLGHILPSLVGSYNYNHDYTPEWMRIYCPSCNSDNVCFLPDYDRWFCISCHSSWIYVREDGS